MARKQAERPKGNWVGFFNYDLRTEDKSGIRALVDSPKRPSFVDVQSELVKSGYKLSISCNEARDTFTVGCTGQDGSQNAGYTIVLHHIQMETAVYAVWFVIGSVFEWGKWPVEETKQPDW